MNVYDYIESKDVREYNEKNKRKFTTLESTFFVWNNSRITLAEKHKAWQSIMDEMSDEQVKKYANDDKTYSLFALLREFIKTDNELIDSFYRNNEKCVYFYRYSYKNEFSRRNFGVAFPDFESAKNAFEIEKNELNESGYFGGIRKIEYKRQSLVFPKKSILIVTDNDGNVLEVNDENYADNELSFFNKDVFFGNQWVDIPTPYKLGDIVCYTDDSGKSIPFVLLSVANWGRSEAFERAGVTGREELIEYESNLKRLKKRGDISDMIANGFFLQTDVDGIYTGEFYVDEMHDYSRAEYYRDKIQGGSRVLTALSLYLQKRIGEDTFVKVCDIIKKQKETATAISKLGVYERIIDELMLKET